MEYDLSLKMSIASELLIHKIAIEFKNGFTVEDTVIKNLLIERNQLYLANVQVIDKVLNVYGPEIDEYYNNLNKNDNSKILVKSF